LFDHLICAHKQRWWNVETKFLRSFYVDQQLELGRPFYRKVSRFGSLEYLVHVVACAAEQVGCIGTVDHQSPAKSIVSEEVICWQMILRRERDNAGSLDIGKRVAGINYRIGVLSSG